MTSKIDVRIIITEHLATLRNNATGKTSFADVAVFFGIPAIAAGICTGFCVSLTLNAIGVLVGALSILAGLLINVLVLLYTVKEVGPSDDASKKQRTLIKEVNANLLYEITIAVAAIVALCVLPLFERPVSIGVSAFVVFLLGNFVLTLLMALKRIKVLLDLRFSESTTP